MLAVHTHNQAGQDGCRSNHPAVVYLLHLLTFTVQQMQQEEEILPT